MSDSRLTSHSDDKMPMQNKWLFLAAFLFVALLQSVQGEISQEELSSSSQGIEELRNGEKLHVELKSNFQKYSDVANKQNQVDADKLSKDDKTAESPTETETPVSADELIDNVLEEMLSLLESVSQNLHNAVKKLPEATPTDKTQKKSETSVSAVESPFSRENMTPDDALRDLDRFLHRTVHISRGIFDLVNQDTKKGVPLKATDEENLKSKMTELLTAPTDMLNLLAPFMYQDVPATSTTSNSNPHLQLHQQI